MPPNTHFLPPSPCFKDSIWVLWKFQCSEFRSPTYIESMAQKFGTIILCQQLPLQTCCGPSKLSLQQEASSRVPCSFRRAFWTGNWCGIQRLDLRQCQKSGSCWGPTQLYTEPFQFPQLSWALVVCCAWQNVLSHCSFRSDWPMDGKRWKIVRAWCRLLWLPKVNQVAPSSNEVFQKADHCVYSTPRS